MVYNPQISILGNLIQPNIYLAYQCLDVYIIHTKMDKISQEITMLPFEEWQALRIISFTIEGLEANFIYKRDVKPSDLKSCSSSQSVKTKYIGKEKDSLDLPLDATDDLLLSWFEVVDENAMIQSKLLIFDSEVRDFKKYYAGVPTAKIQMFAFPKFGAESVEEMKKYKCLPIERYHRDFDIVILGSIPSHKQLSIIGYYDYSKREEMDDLMNNLNQEIKTMEL